MSAPLLEVEDLRVAFRQRGLRAQPLVAVDGASFQLTEGENLGLVGESGSGKTTIGRAILGLVRPTSGRVSVAGTDVTTRDAEDRRDVANRLQVVFQDPYGSLNPSRTIGRTMTEPLELDGGRAPADALEHVRRMLSEVRIPAEAVSRYPHAFSGGQRQRIAIARAMAGSPRLIICDEAVSALDLVTQAQVLNLLKNLQHEHGVSYLFISHNLPIVAYMADRVLVLYSGRIMERGPAADVYAAPLHPYTQALVAAVPVLDPDLQRERRRRRAGDRRANPVPAGTQAGAGCPFAARCPHVADVCWSARPAETAVGEHVVACHAYDATSGHPAQGAGVLAS
jgi:oligopeptide/dipeptide ABC transporter ATP-binding protein